MHGADAVKGQKDFLEQVVLELGAEIEGKDSGIDEEAILGSALLKLEGSWRSFQIGELNKVGK